MHAAEPLPHFVDDFLSFLYEVHPTGATMDGVHTHDDLIEDYRRSAIDTHVSALAGFARRLDAIPVDQLALREQVEHQIVSSNIRARQFELEATRSWERNPHVYADTLASSLAAQAIFTYAPETDRARRVLSKLRQVPRLVQAARDNIKEPPAMFVKVGIDTWRGAMAFIDTDLPRAFMNVDDIHLLGDLDDACKEATRTIGAYVEELSNDVLPKAKGTFRLGRDRFEQKLRLEEGITLPVDKLLAIATRELAATQEEFRQLAGPQERQRSDRGLAQGEAAASRARHADLDRARTARRAAHLPVAQLDHVDARERRRASGADAGLLPLVLGQHVDAGAVRIAAVARDVLPHRRRSQVGSRIARPSTCSTSTCRRCGRFRSTRSTPVTSCTTSSCARSTPRSAARRCSRRRRTWKAGRTTASR